MHTITMKRESVEVKMKKFEISIVTDLGNREEQQDRMIVLENDEELVAAVCDGMGGQSGGALAAQTAIDMLASACEEMTGSFDEMFEDYSKRADEEIYLLTDAAGRRLDAGSTVVAIAIENNHLYILGVGDSRIYLKRGDELNKLTRDQNYGLLLKEWLASGAIDQAEYDRESFKSEALISYLGNGNNEIYDLSGGSDVLRSGDILLLSSDGLYKTMDDETINRILGEKLKMDDIANLIREESYKRVSSERDNMTYILVRYMEEHSGKE